MGSYLWATIKVVRFEQTRLRASWMCRSVVESNAEVASSSKIISGFFSKVLAMATLCFSPPTYNYNYNHYLVKNVIK